MSTFDKHEAQKVVKMGSDSLCICRLHLSGCGRVTNGAQFQLWLTGTMALAKIGMLRHNIGTGVLRLNSRMLRLSLTSSVQGGPTATVPSPIPNLR